MKKTYIIPEIQITEIAFSAMIAESITISGDSSKKTSGANGGWVKDNSASSRDDYNVWDDDWNK